MGQSGLTLAAGLWCSLASVLDAPIHPSDTMGATRIPHTKRGVLRGIMRVPPLYAG